MTDIPPAAGPENLEKRPIKKVATKKKSTGTALPRPVTKLHVELKGVDAQRLFRRLYQRTDIALIWLDTVLDQVASNNELKEADQLIKDGLAKCSDSFKSQIAQMKQLREENGMEDMEVSYKNPQKLTVDAQTPIAIRFINLFKLMDQLMNEVDVLWFAEIIDRSQRKDAAAKARKEISGASTQIINFNTRAQALIKKKKTPSSESDADAMADLPLDDAHQPLSVVSAL